jgi:hypothetical protein
MRDMSKKTRRLLKAKNIRKVIRRNGTKLGVAALTLGGIAVAASPRLRERTRQLRDSVVHRLQSVRESRAARRLASGSGHGVEQDRTVITTAP